jgi:hypothetical protein
MSVRAMTISPIFTFHIARDMMMHLLDMYLSLRRTNGRDTRIALHSKGWP